MVIRFFFILFFCLLPAPFFAADFNLSKVFVWDGITSQPYLASLHIQGDSIKKIVKETSSPVSKGKFEGMYVIPGLINAHVHLLNTAACRAGYGFTPWTALENLTALHQSGFTTVADMGAWPVLLGKIRVWADQNPQKSSRVVFAGPVMTIAKGYPDNWMPAVSRMVGAIALVDAQNAKQVVHQTKQSGASHIKVALQEKSFGGNPIPMMDEETLFTLIDAAHGEGLPLFSHALTIQGYEAGIKMGVDAFIHSPLEELTPQLIDQLATKQIPIIPTVWIWKSPWAVPEEEKAHLRFYQSFVTNKIAKQRENYLKDYFTTEDFPSYLMEETGVSKIAAKKNYEAQKRNLERLRGKNAFFVFGTDAPYCFDMAGDSYKEMLELKKIGFTNEQILLMATLHAAFMLKLPLLGSLAPGQKADMVILNGNPLEDLSVLRDPVAVVRDGEISYGKNKITWNEKVKSILFFAQAAIETIGERLSVKVFEKGLDARRATEAD
ncbi:MAG: hypothetical protein A3G32_10345 [Deltaproteobacteria bacterium RIFCSPLOWO2_12_FULL_40_28]|nr:MAG: hypothetical protein A3C45_05355 [Deltaproteobacteria bacterium RIFCSPHIGHO2_02_FULL_40_28]OGQ20424.1 MAG: hypothetical protein A3E27_00735 [Deltaproteobacteria bacterium RIFCSPHIGHO2_12_FULL_40_32]OGQ41393.1 MAG: hypothetical protein A3I69_02385 [Deltaproteobacteria bacterium RIFCSPLOWO2_02_FULL_40_36]OGQ55032.1 MAG: hypothetical protein A3G32_10345 [Deltaproteobacteria bacterium RIFCSPLOWO2_12_FULL_40_28]